MEQRGNRGTSQGSIPPSRRYFDSVHGPDLLNGPLPSPNGTQGIGNSSQRDRSRGSHHTLDLLENPSDLICPITCDLFVDPVANAVGQIYEREAISEHLQRSSSDPITRQELPSGALTPIFLLRSRAMEYRESTARACLDEATSPECVQPAQFVRRAAELCAGLSVPVQGMNAQCMAYVRAHPSNAFDEGVLQAFARGLHEVGRRDQAAAVYCGLLQGGGADRAKQAQLLCRCLDCWSPATPAFPPSHPDTSLVVKLAHFVNSQTTFSWTHILDILQEAGLGGAFALRLCEQLLLHGGAHDGKEASISGWLEDKQVLCKYIQISCAALSQQQQRIELALAACAATVAALPVQQQQQGASQSGAQQPLAIGEADGGDCRGGRRVWGLRRPRWMDVRAVAAAALTASAMANPGGSVIRRALQLVPLLYILPASG